MAIYKGPVREQFTQIPNSTHQDTSLSLQCRGLLGYLISLPDDWVIRPEQLAKENNIAKNTAYKLIKELKEAGYIFQVQQREQSGKFSSGDYLVFRSLEDARWYIESLENTGVEPCTKIWDTVKRDTVKCELTNKEVNKETEKQKVSQSTVRARENFSADESENSENPGKNPKNHFFTSDPRKMAEQTWIELQTTGLCSGQERYQTCRKASPNRAGPRRR